MGLHICWSSEDFEDWIGFDMEDVEENLKTNQTLYKCLHCDFRVETTENMKEHLQDKHKNQVAAKCIHCEYQDKTWKGMRKHFRIKHRKTFPSL